MTNDLHAKAIDIISNSQGTLAQRRNHGVLCDRLPSVDKRENVSERTVIVNIGENDVGGLSPFFLLDIGDLHGGPVIDLLHHRLQKAPTKVRHPEVTLGQLVTLHDPVNRQGQHA